MREHVYVVGTDFSSPSRAALDAAAALALRTGARIDVVCVVPPSVAHADPDFERRVTAGIATMTRRAGCPDARSHVVVASDAAAAVARHARAVGADLVAVGPRGRSGWKKLVLGTVTERLLRLAPTMLLIVRGKLPASPGKILVAIDRTAGSSRALRVAAELAHETGSKLVALHVAAPAGAALAGAPALYLPATWEMESQRVAQARTDFERWVRRAPTTGVEVEPRVVEGHAVESVLAEAKAADAPLVVVGSHGKTAVHEFFVGSVAHGVATHCPVSVLVVRARPGGGLTVARHARARAERRPKALVPA